MSLTASLTNRIFFGTAALVVVTMGVVMLRVNASVSARSEAELQRGLTDAVTLVESSTSAQIDRFERDARLIASLPVLRGAVATADPPTVQPIAEQYQQLLDSDLTVLLDLRGTVLASVGRFGADRATVAQMLSGRPAGAGGSWFWSYPGGALLMTAVPMEFLGTLVVGVGLDQAVVDRLKALSRSEVTLVSRDTVIVSTLPANEAAALADDRRSGPVPQGRYASRDIRLAPGAPAGGADLVAVVMRSRADHVAFLAALQREMAAAGVLAVLVAILVGYAIARTVTRPIRAVTATMGDMAATGSLAGAVPEPGRWDDEDARVLSSTFRSMTASIARFQREESQRERLWALGRLSAVVAHEVRNPLMIITGAVRTLRRSAPSAEVLAAAASIEEEVTRLNRVVSDVLDFARPLSFARGPADLIAICHDSVAAVLAAGDDVPITCHAGADRLPVETDAERLRSVLVNLLTNAQQAVRDRPPGAREPVVVTAQGPPGGGAQIVVCDRGVGMSAEVQSRAFEPFYTTRRSGSGLGLAITRNIIEGLGGRVSITSDEASGTTVTIDLPARSPQRDAAAEGSDLR